MNTKANASTDMTLLGFSSIDLRTTNVGDTVRFRSASITHSQALPLRHGRTARVAGFSKNRSGQPSVDVQFATDATLGDDTSSKLTSSVSLAPVNLIANTPEAAQAAVEIRKWVTQVVATCAEAGRPWGASLKIKDRLSDQGMYDRLATPTTVQSSLEDLPF